ncbi:RluA family pseudouridine synthase [Buchnera aphidicola (Neophyllaphis podocarpi)]|uniref:RluA family pseudouridine synthase n=1 Tax=Buchnera aphidicola TaxID=9 RepID=UPI0031B87C5A
MLRKGNIRVNKKRVKPKYKLKIKDVVKITNIKFQNKTNKYIDKNIIKLEKSILYEDNYLIIINKPVGISVHGGSGINYGIIERIRLLRSKVKYLELVHRLDKDTSGILIIAKKRSTLVSLHKQIRELTIKKKYLTLVHGSWSKKIKKVDLPILKNKKNKGTNLVKISSLGKKSQTIFEIKKKYFNMTLLYARPITGRTHQIRIHTSHIGHPIIFDNKYGNKILDNKINIQNLRKKIILHAYSIKFIHPNTQNEFYIQAPLSIELQKYLKNLNST